MVVTPLPSQPSQEAETSENAPPTINAWKKLSKGGDSIPDVHPVIDPSSWPTPADSSKKLLELHSPESPSRTPTPDTTSPPPPETLPESASSSSMATASTSDSDQPIKNYEPAPVQMLHPRPSRSPAAQHNQRGQHNQRFPSSNQRGIHNNSFGNRRHQQRPHEWNSSRRAFVPRNFNHSQQYQYQPQGFGMQPPPMPAHPHPAAAAAPVPLYYGPPVPPSVVGYMVPYGYYGEPPFQDVYRPFYNGPAPYPDAMRGVAFHTPPFSLYTPQEDADLCNALLAQIEYYFSDVNLETDDYLKSQMDDQGWVSIYLISGFKRVKRLSQDVNLILKALRPSTVVEIQGYKLRKRGNWMAWLPHSSSSPAHSAQNKLAASMRNLQLDRESEAESVVTESQPVGTHSSIIGASATSLDDELVKENPSTKRQWSC